MTLEKVCTNPSHKSWEFWRLCAIVQVRELEVDLLKKDYEHAFKELVDMATVAADAIRHMGGDFWATLTERVVENEKKSGVFDRDEVFYRAKLRSEEARILELGGKLTEPITLERLKLLEKLAIRQGKCPPGSACGLCNSEAT